MTLKTTPAEYWFTIEPYVYVGLTDTCTLLYNTLDGVTIESDRMEVNELLKELLIPENFGVVLLTEKRYMQNDVRSFIKELREKYMGDVIDVNLSQGKPVQLLPYFNYSSNNIEIYKRHNSPPNKGALDNLSELSIHVDNSTDLTKLLSFLQRTHSNISFNIIGNISEVKNYRKLLSFLDQLLSPKSIICSYLHISSIRPLFENNFSYRIKVDFPVDIKQWNNVQQLLRYREFPVDFIFNVSSEDDYSQTEQIVERFQIEEYHINPIYTVDNIRFFEEHVFLTREDILSTSMSIKDFFSRQSMNLYDFGKINIMPNGDAYANVNHPVLGNIYTHNILEIVSNEMIKGQSWFRIRNQAPCNNCIYQWLCPPPSNHEIVIGRPNLCHVKQ